MMVNDSETSKRIRQLRTDAILGKKKHYNAADRKQRYQTRIGIAIIVINVILGSAFLILLKDMVPEYMKWIGAGLALLAALLSAIHSFFGFSKALQGHRAVAGRYLDLAKNCSNVLAKFSDGVITNEQLAKELSSFTSTMSKIDSDANSYPTNKDDFDLARSGIDSGEEHYTDTDLSIGS